MSQLELLDNLLHLIMKLDVRTSSCITNRLNSGIQFTCLFKGMSFNIFPYFLRKYLFTNKQISWVICSVGTSQNDHMKISESEYRSVQKLRCHLPPVDWKQLDLPNFTNFYMFILKSPYQAYDSRYLLICEHAFSEKNRVKILILIPLYHLRLQGRMMTHA